MRKYKPLLEALLAKGSKVLYNAKDRTNPKLKQSTIRFIKDDEVWLEDGAVLYKDEQVYSKNDIKLHHDFVVL